MKQKLLGEVLYVFDTVPYEITEDASEASVIKVQEEVLKGFVELNEALSDKFVPYNYHVVCVNVTEWAPYVDQPDPEPPVVENHTFTLYPGEFGGKTVVNFSDGQMYFPTRDYDHMPGNENPIYVEGYGEYEGMVYTYEVPENIEITLRPAEGIENYTYDTSVYTYDSETQSLTPSIVMDADKAVYCVYKEQQTVTLTVPHDLNIYDEAAGDWVHMTQDESNPDIDTGSIVVGKTYTVEQRRGVGQGKVVTFNPECGIGQGSLGASFVTPDEDVTITLSDPQNYTLKLEGQKLYSSNIRTDLDGTDVGFWTLMGTGRQVAEGTLIEIYLLTENESDYDTTSISTWMTLSTDGGLHYYANMPSEDKTINISYIGTPA